MEDKSAYPELGDALLSHARASIAEHLGLQAESKLDHPALHETGASFVTLSKNGLLRGCMGQLEARRLLGLDVSHNALAAAFQDPRFPPVSRAEWPDLAVEVSVLGPVQYAYCPTEEDCLRQIVPFEDGVILSSGFRRATFLPQVWEQFSSKEEFLRQLSLKARGGADLWSQPGTEVLVYQVEAFKER